MKRLPLLLLLTALFAPAAAEDVVVGEMDEPCVLPFCGG
jgi:hypothetical protein